MCDYNTWIVHMRVAEHSHVLCLLELKKFKTFSNKNDIKILAKSDE